MTAAGNTANWFDICAHGAAGDGKSNDTAAVQAAIDACHAAGGGVVYCPPGEYMIGTIELKSNVNLHIEAGATLQGSTHREHYRTRDCVEAKNPWSREHLIFASEADNVAITGRGRIDGNGDAFFGDMHPEGTHLRVKGFRPYQMIGFVLCGNVVVESATISNSPGWALWLFGCRHARIHGIRIRNNRLGPNTDGIDLDCCQGVRISDCYLDCGDDCIALKGDGALLGEDMACEDIVVTNCTMITSTCGVRVGYEGDGTIRNCTFSNLTMSNTRTGIGINVPYAPQTEIHRGAQIENILFSNITMETRLPIFAWIGDGTTTPACMRNIRISDVVATTERGCFIGGSRSNPIEGFHLSNIDLIAAGEMDDGMADEVPDPYNVWEYWTRNRGIPHALYLRHVRGATLNNVRVRWGQPHDHWRSALRCEDVSELDVVGLVASQAPGATDAAAVHLSDVQTASIRACRAAAGTTTFLRTDGQSTRVSAVGNDLNQELGNT